MTFEGPWTLLLLPLWIALFARFVATQRRALRWIDEHVGPRFRRRLTAWTPSSARRHLWYLAVVGALLILAASGPAWLTGEAKVQGGGRLLLAVDASVSMAARDVQVAGREEMTTRFDVAKELAAELTRQLSDWQVGLASWSGIATVHLPLHDDGSLTADAIEDLNIHNFYRSSGSSFESILDVALRFHDPAENGLQVLLLSDGEMPRPELYEDALAALVEAGVVVHSVGIGGAEPVGLRIFDPQDFGKPKEERAVLRAFETRRVDEHLNRISHATGGALWRVPDTLTSTVSESPSEASIPRLAERLAADLRSTEVSAGAQQRERAQRDLTPWLLALVLLGVVLDLHCLARGRGGTPTFRLDHIGRQRERSPAQTVASIGLLLLVALLPVSCSQGSLWGLLGGPVWRAHAANEKGLDLDAVGRRTAAETSFLRSAAFRVEPQTPTYNHARSRTEAEDFAGAHELNEKALVLAPHFDEAQYNDGVVLYRWGAEEVDPRGCELDRTLDLWRSALDRFDDVRTSAGDQDLSRRAAEQVEAVRREIARLEQLVAEPPQQCRSESQSQSQSRSQSGAPDESEAGGGGGGGGSDEEGGGQGEAGGGDNGEGSPDEGSGQPPDEPPPGQAEPEPAEGDAPSRGGDGGLSYSEFRQILGELKRIQAQAQEDGKFHYRTASEQTDEESLSDPDEIWW